MTLPTSGPISLTDIQTEFGGNASLSEYYKGGAYVLDVDYAPNVPRSGQISINDFYGAAKTRYFCFTYYSNDALILPATFRTPLIVSALGGGGGAGGDDAGAPGYPGYAGAIVTGNVAASPGDIVNVYIGGGGGGGANGTIATPGYGGSSSNGYNGGGGGASGGAGTSGAGGGGGGATNLAVNGGVKLVAAGGGGGGGAGYYNSGKPNQNTPGTNSSVYGATGQYKSGDGGGGGGGGGGSPAVGSFVSPVPTVYPGSYPVYCGFLNTYGVWTSPDFVNPVGQWVTVNYTITVNYVPGIFYAEASADNHMRMFVNGAPTINSDAYQYPTIGAPTPSGGFNNFNFGGPNTITIMALNDGGPALFAGAIYDPNGNMIWNTRMISSAGGGGAGGSTVAGDSGAYSGENGTNLVPTGGSASTGSNGGASSGAPGGAGSMTVCYWAS